MTLSHLMSFKIFHTSLQLKKKKLQCIGLLQQSSPAPAMQLSLLSPLPTLFSSPPAPPMMKAMEVCSIQFCCIHTARAPPVGTLHISFIFGFLFCLEQHKPPYCVFSASSYLTCIRNHVSAYFLHLLL